MVFKRVMRNKELCREFLSIILEREVTSLEYVETEYEALGDIGSKEARLDCFSITSDGELFDVEMQVGDEADLSRRLRGYQSIIDRDALSKGWDGETMSFRRMPNSYIIFICTEHPFKRQTSRRLCKRTFPRCCSEEPGLVLDTGAMWVVFDAKMWEEATDPRVKKLLRYVANSEFEPEDGFLSRLDAEVRLFVNGDEWRMLLDSRVEARTEGYDEGEAVGMAKGEAKGEAKFAKLIKALRKDKRDDQIDIVLDDPKCREELMREYGIE